MQYVLPKCECIRRLRLPFLLNNKLPLLRDPVSKRRRTHILGCVLGDLAAADLKIRSECASSMSKLPTMAFPFSAHLLVTAGSALIALFSADVLGQHTRPEISIGPAPMTKPVAE